MNSGVPEPRPGVMPTRQQAPESPTRGVAEPATQYAPWLALWPGLCLTLLVYRFNMLRDAMRDLLDRACAAAAAASTPAAPDSSD